MTANLEPPAAKTRGESHLPPGDTVYVLGIQLLPPAVAQGDNLARGEDNHGAQDAKLLVFEGGQSFLIVDIDGTIETVNEADPEISRV